MVRALDWGSRSREFESHHSDFLKTRMVEGKFSFPVNHAGCALPCYLPAT